MINIDDELKNEYLKNSVSKTLRIHVESEEDRDLSNVNWMLQYVDDGKGRGFDYWTNQTFTVGIPTLFFVDDLKDGNIDLDFLDEADYFRISIKAMLEASVSLPSKFRVDISYQYEQPLGSKPGIYVRTLSGYINTSSVLTGNRNIYGQINCTGSIKIEDTNRIRKINYFGVTFEPDSSHALNSTVTVSYFKLGGIQFDLLKESQKEMPLKNIQNDYIADGTYMQHISLGSGPAIPDIVMSDLEAESFSLTESLCSNDNLKFGSIEASNCSFTIANRPENFNYRYIRPYIKTNSSDVEIPLGRFKINSVKKQQSYTLVKKNITAYDDLSKLDQPVGDWLTKYMVCLQNLNNQRFARQMLSAYINLTSRLGINIGTKFRRDSVIVNMRTNQLTTYKAAQTIKPPKNNLATSIPTTMGLYTVYDAPTKSDIYIRVSVEPRTSSDNTYPTDKQISESQLHIDDEHDWFDNAAGVRFNGGIFVAVYRQTSSTSIKYLSGYLCDSGDICYIPPEINGEVVDWVRILVANEPCFIQEGVGKPQMASSVSNLTVKSVLVEKLAVINEAMLPQVNKGTMLSYYNYDTCESTTFDSSVTGREALRSLLEICGCFLNINRYGYYELRYATKSGIYPSTSLFPNSELYPRGIGGPCLSREDYITFEAEDYTVGKIGKIQIKTGNQASSKSSICSFEYIGDENNPSTYVINDNIFYSGDGVVYSYAKQIEVADMLKNLYSVICEVDYTPNVTKLPGLPYIEPGDRIVVLTETDGFESFVFRRTLQGIQALKDTYESFGDECTEAINTFDYDVYKPT